jgi:MATE family multidrug resistance protein
MYVVDRIILAGYSVEAMYAATVSGNFVAILAWVLVGIASTAEVFVGQFNGAKQFDKLEIPIWQMVYMSLASAVVFFPIGYFSEYINFLPDYALDYGVAYQRPLCYFGFLPSLIAGLSAFFIGQGKTRIVTVVVISGNVLNAFMSYYFVYYLNGGTSGAATATVISEIVQAIVLAVMFLQGSNKNFSFNKKMLLNCIRIGWPVSIGHFFMILAWYVISTITGYSSKKLGVTWGIACNIYIISSFFSEGATKATAAIVSNMIGRRDIGSVFVVFKKFMLLVIAFTLLLSIPMVFFPDMTLNLLNLVNSDISDLRTELLDVLKFSLGCLFIESAVYIIGGVLMAGGDTKYTTIVSQVCFWGIVVIPTCILHALGKLTSVVEVYTAMTLSFTLIFIFIYRRFMTKKWINKLNALL